MYSLVICGGTFDLLHNGHKVLLDKAFSTSQKVLIGVNTDRFADEHGKNPYQNQDERKAEVEEYLREKGWLDRAEFHFHDDFSKCPAVNKSDLEAIVVSKETIKGADQVNYQRGKEGLMRLKIVIGEIQKAQDGSTISSSRIRNGEINREGKLYIYPPWNGHSLILPQTLRSELAKSFGKILQDVPESVNSNQTITVGDVTTQLFNEKNIDHKLSVVDFIVKREKKFDQLSELGFTDRIETQIVKNPAGQISWELIEAIMKSLSIERAVILVNGEEDLAVLPAVLIAPLGFTIYYGQPNEGLVQVVVDENTKKRAKELANKFVLS